MLTYQSSLTIILLCTWIHSSSALAQSTPVKSSKAEGSLTAFESVQFAEMRSLQGSVTSVSQLSDVQTTDWAFQSLQSLIQRYGILAGYPDQTFQGDRAITRYEFAAALNTILEQIDERMSLEGEFRLSNDDLEIIQRLQSEFSSELSALQGRVGELETRTAELDANQFC